MILVAWAGAGSRAMPFLARKTTIATKAILPFRSTNVLRRQAAYPIASSSSIMPAITDRPPSQKLGFLASRPNGASSSE